MYRPVKLAVRFVALLSLMMMVPAVFLEPSPTSSPYATALSDLPEGPVAAAGCGNRACDVTQFRTCFNNPGTRCKLNVRTAAGCATVPC